MNLLTLDVETTMNASKDIGESHPMHPSNSIVLLGTICYTEKDGRPYEKKVETYSTLPATALFDDITNTNPEFIVGCNISFDLLYLYKVAPEIKVKLQKHRLWDIQLAEYLLTAQQSKWPSLDEMSKKYGLPVKDDKVSAYFAAGIGSDKIPMELLEPYLIQDLENTQAIALIQIQEAVLEGQLPLIISQMEALHCVTEMMFNGLVIDLEYFKKYTSEVATTYADLKITLESNLKAIRDTTEHYPIDDIGSATQWSKFLFGGPLKVVKDEPVGVFKNGNTKYKKVTTLVETKPACEIVPLEEWKSEKTGKVSVDEKVLTTIVETTKMKGTKELVKKLLAYRETSKQLSTYIHGLGKHMMEVPQGTYVFGRLSQVATATGRLSSSSPNLQNISNNPIKGAFVSRYKEQGNLIEFDFSQLEIAILAHVTKDKQLIADITRGKDIHSELFNDMNGRFPDDVERKWFKRLTFGLVYGAGANTLASNAGCDYSVAKKFISTFYSRYPGVHIWHETMANVADLKGTHLPKDGSLEITRTWVWKSETGRKYAFKEYKSTWGDKEYSFSPTELKNYPIQGLATGDIVPMMLGILFRKFVNKKGITLVNTVHDSIMFDVHNDVLTTTLKEINAILSNTDEYFKKTFEVPLALKLNASASVGKNWYITEKVEI